MRYILVVLLILLYSCSNPDLKLLSINLDKVNIDSHKSNRYIGYTDLYKVRKDKNISGVWVYEKYIITERITEDHVSGFDVYKFDKHKRFNEYISIEKPIVSKEGPYWPIGIFSDYLFVDIGTGPSIRLLEIIELKQGNVIYSGTWNGKHIELLAPEKVVVYEFYNESFPNDERGWTTKNILHAFSFNLLTHDKENLNKTYEVITN